MTARGLFRATGNVAKPVMVDLIDGEPVYAESIPREADDFYPTPPEPIRGLLNAERERLARFPVIWEAAAGDGALACEIESAGFAVELSDLVDRGCGAEISNFYGYTEAKSPALITNPPFQECNTGAWIKHALEALNVEYMALLLPLNWPGAQSRAGLWSKHPPARVYLMQWRIDFTGAGAPPMLNAWYVWDGVTDASDTRFLMMSKSMADGRGLF